MSPVLYRREHGFEVGDATILAISDLANKFKNFNNNNNNKCPRIVSFGTSRNENPISLTRFDGQKCSGDYLVFAGPHVDGDRSTPMQSGNGIPQSARRGRIETSTALAGPTPAELRHFQNTTTKPTNLLYLGLRESRVLRLGESGSGHPDLPSDGASQRHQIQDF